VNETARTVAKEILEPKIVWIVSQKVLNGIFGNGCCTGEVADAHKTRFDQIKSQTRIQYWNTREITDDKNKKVGLKKKVKLLYKSVFFVQTQSTLKKEIKQVTTLLTQNLPPPPLNSLPV
jgi:hypothetical protein